ncbi:hypothetical protein [Agrobacterium rosae]|uniref:hypothetical protein n=1 Tax=Agrobacterium rosae TaxID=1972867 RepID=UPI00203369D4|nr:hypothetical protein [Agrobacterium rosae]
MVELPANTREFLAGLRPDELETLQAITEEHAEEVAEVFRIVRDLWTLLKNIRWLIYFVIALFLGSMALYENFLKFSDIYREAQSHEAHFLESFWRHDLCAGRLGIGQPWYLVVDRNPSIKYEEAKALSPTVEQGGDARNRILRIPYPHLPACDDTLASGLCQ